MLLRVLLLCVTLPPLLSVPRLAAQDRLKRAVPDKTSIVVDPRAHEPDLVVVKLAEGSGARLGDGAIVTGTPNRDHALAAAIQGRRVRMLFAGLERELAVIDARLEAELPGSARRAPDLRLYFTVETRGYRDSRAVIDALHALDVVEIAYPKEKPTPPPGDIPPATPSYSSQQGYLGAAPLGLDAAAARQLIGGWGAGVAVDDIEWSWWLDHEDLAKLRPSSVIGQQIARTSYADHGTAVFGELSGDPDQYGVTGLTPDITGYVTTNYPATGYSVAIAIAAALGATRNNQPVLRRGDVMLLEAQTQTPLGLGPTEYVQADFDAILKAVQAGLIVVEAAGNGGVNLDDPRLGGLFDLNRRDSGAIIVGASDGSASTRASFSSYGSRVDANGWGADVTTTGYGDLFRSGNDTRQFYTSTFGGTSSASPMVTSSVVALLGGARAQWSPQRADAMVDYKTIRTLLRTYGTPLASGQGIGLRPDLRKLLKGAGLIRGLELLDDVQPGKSFRIRIDADFNAGASDAWVLLGAAQPANVGVPFLISPCDRLLLDPAAFFAFTAGSFSTGSSQVLSLTVPNDPTLKLGRYYFQALTLRSHDSRLCLSSGAMAFVMP